MTHMLAAKYPDAQVIGVDMAPVLVSRHGMRPNVEYIQGDIKELIGRHPRLGLGSFDYIFQRFLLFGIRDWGNHLETISTLLRT